MSYRSMIRHNSRNLIVAMGPDKKWQLGAQSTNGADTTWFGPKYDSRADAVTAGKAKFGKLASDPVTRRLSMPAPKGWDTYDSSTEDTPAKPLGILPAPEPIKADDYDAMTVPALKLACKAKGLKGYSKLARAGLLEMLKAA